MKLNYPKVHTCTDQKVFISLYIQNKRYRLYNGKRIGSKISPNSFPVQQRKAIANLLAAEVHKYLLQGGVLKSFRTDNVIIGTPSSKDYLRHALETKLKGDYSAKYKKMLQGVYDSITQTMKGEELSCKHIEIYLERYSCGVSFNTIRRHLNVLINEAVSKGMRLDFKTKSRKAKSMLNKPFNNITDLLCEIKAYNHKLYLCCLMTYGCLLRPHREIRELSWGDFSDDLCFINLSGKRNKSGRNRIVPVPSYIRSILVRGEAQNNIFSGKHQPLNEDYFTTLWSRFKAQSNTLEQGQTLYSFRHSGAIDIYKRTGSLTKLQKAMGHSSLAVSLTYLRGLEVAELTEEDMPRV